MSVCSVGTYLDCSSSDRLDPDVFLLNACKFSDETNYKFFYEFFGMFDKVNSSVCYQNVYTKHKFGPYHDPCCTFAVIYF